VQILELEQFLRDNHVAFHPDHLGDVGDAARAIAQALDLDDQVDRVGDLLRDRFLRNLDVAHQNHVFHTAKTFARAVRVERTHRTVVTGVHRGEQVETLGAANLAHDDAIRAHTQRVLDQDTHMADASVIYVSEPGYTP